MSRRTLRVSEQIRAETARILRQEASDPRLELVTLTRVDVTADLSRATLHWSHLDPGAGRSTEEVAEGLERAAPFVRGRLAELLPLRRVPEIHFRRDDALEQGDRTLAVLRELKDERASRESTADPDATSGETDGARQGEDGEA